MLLKLLEWKGLVTVLVYVFVPHQIYASTRLWHRSHVTSAFVKAEEFGKWKYRPTKNNFVVRLAFRLAKCEVKSKCQIPETNSSQLQSLALFWKCNCLSFLLIWRSSEWARWRHKVPTEREPILFRKVSIGFAAWDSLYWRSVCTLSPMMLEPWIITTLDV